MNTGNATLFALKGNANFFRIRLGFPKHAPRIHKRIQGSVPKAFKTFEEIN